MALNYETTNWENGKTVLKAEHLRKIEKGITDIIAENDAIYTDEDTRKSNEKQRQEEHSRKMNEVSEVVSDIQKDYDSLQKIIIDENASANLQKQINSVNSQLEHIDTHTQGYINVKEFGAKGDSVTDDTQALQLSLIYAFRNKKSIKIPNGIYKISKPLVIFGHSNELHSGIKIVGESIENTIISVSSNFETHNLNNDLGVSSVFIIGNESNIDDSNNLRSSSSTDNISNSRIIISTMKLMCNNHCDYGIWTGQNHSSRYELMRIRNANKVGITNGGDILRRNFFLNTIREVRVDGSEISFLIGSGINTSVNIESCYSVSATKIGYKIHGIYMNMLNCCIDNCAGICYDFTGYRGNATNLGSESDGCATTLKFGQHTNITINGGLLYGNYDSSDYVCCLLEAGAYVDINGAYLAFDKSETNRNLSGYMFKQGDLSSLNIKNCRFPMNYKKDDSPKAYHQYFSIKDNNGSINTRHKNDLIFLGYNTNLENNNANYSNAQAIYMGMGEGFGWLSDGTDVRWHKPASVGDLCLTKTPTTSLCGGYVNMMPGNGFSSGGAIWNRIPIIFADTSINIKAMDSTKIANGTQVFATDLGKPLWKKNTNIWVDATGMQV